VGQLDKIYIYNVFPLLAGKFTDWASHFSRASRMGFNWIFLNPVQRPGMSGSLYSIADYYGFNPLLLDDTSSKRPEDQVRELLKGAGSMGLHVMIDLVVNHCSVDSPITESHPEWFLREEDGSIAHPFADENGKKVVWGDLARFDHESSKDREGLYRYFHAIVKHLLELGFRGFRCDAAYQVPQDFWSRLISEVKEAYPEVLFFAETLGCTPSETRRTADAGFDYIFNSSKWWDFKSPWLMKQYVVTRDIAPSISFPESHDTVRLCEELDGNIDGIKQRYLFCALFSAGIMIPIGFEFGFRKKLHVVETRPENWEETGIDLTGFIADVNGIKGEHAIFLEDSPTLVLQADNPEILLMWKGSSRSDAEALLIMNKDVQNPQRFYAENIRDYLNGGAPIIDISPEKALGHVPTPFSVDLRPGGCIVLAVPQE